MFLRDILPDGPSVKTTLDMLPPDLPEPSAGGTHSNSWVFDLQARFSHLEQQLL